jgi:hypothetical protein
MAIPFQANPPKKFKTLTIAAFVEPNGRNQVNAMLGTTGYAGELMCPVPIRHSLTIPHILLPAFRAKSQGRTCTEAIRNPAQHRLQSHAPAIKENRMGTLMTLGGKKRSVIRIERCRID